MTVFVDPAMPADALRQTLYDGNLVILTRLRAVADFVDYARDQLTELFSPHDPEQAHEHFDPPEMAKLLGAWKPSFIHSDLSKKLVRGIITEAGLPAEYTHYDLPKPRTSFPVGHLTTGVAFAFPWHRDVWYSAPAQQLNWWLPIFPAREDNSMSFDLPSFGRPVPNSSGSFDYYENNARRLTTATSVTKEQQARPGALDHKPAHELVVLPEPGAVLLFPVPSCISRFRTPPGGPGTASISAPSMPGTCWQGGAHHWWTPIARERRYGTSITSPMAAHSTRTASPSCSGRRPPMRCSCSARRRNAQPSRPEPVTVAQAEEDRGGAPGRRLGLFAVFRDLIMDRLLACAGELAGGTCGLWPGAGAST